MKTKKEIEDMMDKALENKSILDRNLSGMTYAEGVEAALRWAIGATADEPVSDDDCDASRS